MDAEMLRNVLTMLGTVLGAILVLMLVAKITSMVHVEATMRARRLTAWKRASSASARW